MAGEIHPIHPFTEVPYEAVGGVKKARQKVRDRLIYWEKTKRKVMHPHMGMAAKQFPPFMVDAAIAECDKHLLFYEDLLEDI